jgi:hypothetical protein
LVPALRRQRLGAESSEAGYVYQKPSEYAQGDKMIPLTEVRLIIERLDPMLLKWWPTPGGVFTEDERTKAKDAASLMEGTIRLLRVEGERALVLQEFSGGLL